MPEQDSAERDPEAEPTAIDVLTGEQIHGDAGPAEAIPDDELPVSEGVIIDPATGEAIVTARQAIDFGDDIPPDGQEPSEVDEEIAEARDASEVFAEIEESVLDAIPDDTLEPIDEVEWLLDRTLKKLDHLRTARPNVRPLDKAKAQLLQARFSIREARR